MFRTGNVGVILGSLFHQGLCLLGLKGDIPDAREAARLAREVRPLLCTRCTGITVCYVGARGV
jgi:hypothetical protein